MEGSVLSFLKAEWNKYGRKHRSMEGSVLSFLKAEWKWATQAQRTEPLVWFISNLKIR
jgi:hypothetical protein